MALDVGVIFFSKVLFTEVVLGSLQSLVKAVILKTTDTNTRVRKKSVDIINQIWNSQPPSSGHQINKEATKQESISTLIADTLVDQSLQEKAIIGRLGLFIKRASSIESGEDLNTKPH